MIDKEFESMVDELNAKADALQMSKCAAGYTMKDAGRDCYKCDRFEQCRKDALAWLEDLDKCLKKWGF